MFKVTIYGGGSSRCKQLRVRVHNALWMLGIRNFQIEVEDDERKYPEGVTEVPAITVDGKIISCGDMLEIVDIQRMLAPFAYRRTKTVAA
jgi:hypothetical protein